VTGNFEIKRPYEGGFSEFIAKTINIDSEDVYLHIYKTSNDKHFGKIVNRMAYRYVVGGILVYDITRRETFEHLTGWLEDIREDGHPEVPLILIGNKCDLESERAVSYNEGDSFASKNGLFFLEVSAKSGDNVQEAFQKMIEMIHEKIKSGVIATDHKDQRNFVVAGFRSTPKEFQEKKKDYGCGDCACW